MRMTIRKEKEKEKKRKKEKTEIINKKGRKNNKGANSAFHIVA